MHSTTRHHFHSLIRAALNQAIRWRWLSPPNPASEAQAPALAPDERVPPTPEEARRLALAVSKENPDLAALIFVDATTGMRRGEICGLRFCDIDAEAGAAVIWWRCSDLPKDQTAALAGKGAVLKAFPNGVVMLSATKNKNRRRFALDPITLAVLLERKARAEERGAAVGVDLAPGAFVWSQSAVRCEPWRPDRVAGAFTALRNREGLRHICVDDLRRFSATQLVAAGIDPRLVAGRLGHGGSVLLRIYSHVIPARDQAAAQLLGELVRGEAGWGPGLIRRGTPRGPGESPVLLDPAPGYGAPDRGCGGKERKRPCLSRAATMPSRRVRSGLPLRGDEGPKPPHRPYRGQGG